VFTVAPYLTGVEKTLEEVDEKDWPACRSTCDAGNDLPSPDVALSVDECVFTEAGAFSLTFKGRCKRSVEDSVSGVVGLTAPLAVLLFLMTIDF
jgi:hypothetical protein